jgi:hypothetical protein
MASGKESWWTSPDFARLLPWMTVGGSDVEPVDRWLERLTAGKQRRDEEVAQSKREFVNLVRSAHKAGVTAVDIRLATGLSQVTIREIIKSEHIDR